MNLHRCLLCKVYWMLACQAVVRMLKCMSYSTLIISSSGSVSLLNDSNAWTLVMQWAKDMINFPTLMWTIEDMFGNHYIYSEWQDFMSQVFALSKKDDGRAATAAKAAMDACGIVLSGVNLPPGPSVPQAIDVPHPNPTHQIIKSSGKLPMMGTLLMVAARPCSENLPSEPAVQ